VRARARARASGSFPRPTDPNHFPFHCRTKKSAHTGPDNIVFTYAAVSVSVSVASTDDDAADAVGVALAARLGSPPPWRAQRTDVSSGVSALGDCYSPGPQGTLSRPLSDRILTRARERARGTAELGGFNFYFQALTQPEPRARERESESDPLRRAVACSDSPPLSLSSRSPDERETLNRRARAPGASEDPWPSSVLQPSPGDAPRRRSSATLLGDAPRRCSSATLLGDVPQQRSSAAVLALDTSTTRHYLRALLPVHSLSRLLRLSPRCRIIGLDASSSWGGRARTVYSPLSTRSAVLRSALSEAH
jgi:hypothetical protein